MVQIILDLHEAGMRPYHIEKRLNAWGIFTRSGKRWFARTVTDIIERRSDYSSRRTVV